jgi:hypothetical protein
MSDLPVGSSTIAREEEEVMEELQSLLAPDVQDIDMMLYEDFDLPSELDDDPERVRQNAEREGSQPRTANDDAEAGPSTMVHQCCRRRCRPQWHECHSTSPGM